MIVAPEERNISIFTGPLGEKIGSNPYAPTRAQAQALLNIYRGRPVSENIQQAVLDQAKVSKDGLQQQLDLWNQAPSHFRADPRIREIALQNLITGIILSDGITTRTEQNLKKLSLSNTLVLGVTEETLGDF